MVGQRHDPWSRAAITLAAITLVVVLVLGRLGLADEPPMPENTAGRLLVAVRAMPDPRFAETVIYMVTHDESGAIGVVVNRPMGEVTLAALLDGLGLDGEAVEGKLGVHYGGPVENDLGFVLHTSDDFDLSGGDFIGEAGGYVLSLDGGVVRAMAASAGPRRAAA